MLPKALEINEQKRILKDGKKISPFEAAIYWADQLLLQLEKPEENETTSTIIS